jgi:CRP-like cAMP-binding protein
VEVSPISLPGLEQAMNTVLDQPISLEAVVKFLDTTPFFDKLDPFERAEVIRIMEVLRLQGDEIVLREGAAGDAWYVIFEGEVRVLKNSPAGPVETSRLRPGECFGEMAILDGLPRSATVKAAGPLTLFRFQRSRFEDLLEQGSLGAYKLVAAMARLLSKRHRILTHRIVDLISANPSLQQARLASEEVDRYHVSE